MVEEDERVKASDHVAYAALKYTHAIEMAGEGKGGESNVCRTIPHRHGPESDQKAPVVSLSSSYYSRILAC